MDNNPDTVTISWADYCQLLNACWRDTNHALDTAARLSDVSKGAAESCYKQAKKNADMLRRLAPDWPAPVWWP